MALIAPNICRYTVVGTLAGQDCQNVFDIRIIGALGESREDAIPRIAGDLLNQWSDHVLPQLVNDYTAIAVRWVDLDSADGSTGSVSATDGSTWPEQGGRDDPPLPNNVYAKMVKNLEGKGRQQRNGTLRLGGLAENGTDAAAPNTLTAGQRANFNTAFEDLKDGINGGVEGAETNLVVVHTVNKVYAGYSEIAFYSCAPVVGTIRRRMPGYGS